MRRTGILALVSIVMGLLTVSPAKAHSLWHPDADDTSSRLDLSGVRLRHDPTSHHYVVKITSYQGFSFADDGWIGFDIDSFGGPRRDFGGLMYWDGGSSGVFCLGRAYSSRHPESPEIRCDYDDDGDNRAKMIIASRFYQNKAVRWRVYTEDPEDEHVVDRAPSGGGWYAH